MAKRCGAYVSGRCRGTADGAPYAQAVYDDGHGKSEVAADVEAGDAVFDCPSPNPDPTTSCSVTHVRGGTLVIYKGWEYPDHRVDTKEWRAVFRTASGASVGFSEWNSSQEKGAPVPRPEPPLSAAQLTAVVTSPAWQRVIDALPAPDTAGVPGVWGSPGKDRGTGPAKGPAGPAK
jgi:hypothetical protein